MRCFRLDFGNYPQDLLETLLVVLEGYLKGYLGQDGMPSTKLIASDACLQLDKDDLQIENIRLFGGFCGRDSGIGPAQRAKTTIWN